MSWESLATLTAAVASSVAAVVVAIVATSLRRRVRDLQEAVKDLSAETVPLVRDARVVMDQAATEMERVGDVLASAEAVSGTVDSASRLAYRVFANPVVKVIAFSTGLRSASRRMLVGPPSSRRSHAKSAGERERSPLQATNPREPEGHRRRRRSRGERRARGEGRPRGERRANRTKVA